jgi:hypothetical protein
LRPRWQLKGLSCDPQCTRWPILQSLHPDCKSATTFHPKGPQAFAVREYLRLGRY